ncbi:MAG: hypothetical protein U0136_02905 [Bdellovibrionota bacterium]
MTHPRHARRLHFILAALPLCLPIQPASAGCGGLSGKDAVDCRKAEQAARAAALTQRAELKTWQENILCPKSYKLNSRAYKACIRERELTNSERELFAIWFDKQKGSESRPSAEQERN